MNSNNNQSVYELDLVSHPSPTCPPWCVMGIDGNHAGKLHSPPPDMRTPGQHIYVRRLETPDGAMLIEAIVVKTGGDIVRVLVPAPQGVQGESG